MNVIDIVEIHGDHESQEGIVRWGYALYDYDKCELIGGPLYHEVDAAIEAIDTKSYKLQTIDESYGEYFPNDNRPIIGHCSKCGEAREDDYTCRKGGKTIPLAELSEEAK